MSTWLQKLNPEQRRAAATINGPLLVLAGAGSGKTRVITHRIAHMTSEGIPADRILAVTFTNKAAEEMRQRLTNMVGPGAAGQVTMSTFHSLGLQMLRTEAARSRRRQRFTIFDASDQYSCLREITNRLRLERSLDLSAILQRISAYKNAFIAPADLPPSEDPYDQAAAIYYPAYLEQLSAFAAYDFDDLICEPCRLLARSATCAGRWAERFRYVLVDEYQDTSPAQLQMLTLIVKSHGNLCVVGDDDQSIYGWRGADVKNILRFERDFPGGEVITLARNYRSSGAILELANTVIAANPRRHKKTLLATREPGVKVRLAVLPDGESEASWVAEQIRAAVHKRGMMPGDVAVLYRSNLLAREFETALRAVGLEYRVLGGTAFYESKEVKDLIAYLRLCHNPTDEISLRRVINLPPRGIGPRTVARLSAWAEQQGAPFHRALAGARAILGDDNRQVRPLEAFSALIKRSRGTFKNGRLLHQGLAQLVEELDLREVIRRSGGSSKGVDFRVARIEALIQSVRTYCEKATKPSLADFLHRTALLSSEEDLDRVPGDRVTLCTLHGVKGLEYPMVFLVGLEEGLLPHDRTINPHQTDLVSGDINEERRLCYVGITRAMTELVLTRCRDRMIHGKLQPRTPSRFLEPVPEGMLEEEDLTRAVEPEQVQAMVAELLAKLEG